MKPRERLSETSATPTARRDSKTDPSPHTGRTKHTRDVVVDCWVIRNAKFQRVNGSARGIRLERRRVADTLAGLTSRSRFRHFKASPEIIRLAVTLPIRTPLSPGNVEDLPTSAAPR